MPSQVDEGFATLLKEWLERQGPTYKRADLAYRIGLTPRSLNRVIQGTRGLSTKARARALAVISPPEVTDHSLKEWLAQRKMSVGQLAMLLNKPVKTVEDWVYRGKTPSVENSALLSSVTGLSELSSRRADRGATTDKVDETQAVSSGKSAARGVYRLMGQLQTVIRGPRAARDSFRRQVKGADIGYLRSALAALLDEQQFEDWRRMSSYSPRHGGRS